jgi:hypothetical protein
MAPYCNAKRATGKLAIGDRGWVEILTMGYRSEPTLRFGKAQPLRWEMLLDMSLGTSNEQCVVI